MTTPPPDPAQVSAEDRSCAMAVAYKLAIRGVTDDDQYRHEAAKIVADHIAATTAALAKERDEARAQVGAAERENARLVAALLFCDSFADQCETAEDRSNLDGDSAEAVLLQINEAASEARAKIAQALAPAPAGGSDK